MSTPLRFAVLAVCCAFATARAAVIPVGTLLDADVADGDCSLREAIVAANTDAAYRDCPAGNGTDRIDISLPGTILLGGDLPQITTSVEIIGPEAAELSIDGSGQHRPFHVVGGSGFLFQLRRLIVRDGHAAADGGCLTIPGGAEALVLRRVRFEGCSSDGNGGAVDAFAVTLTTIDASTFEGNRSGGSGGALRLWNFGAAEIEDTTFSGNEAGTISGSGGAGAIQVSFVDLSLVRSTISGNSAAGVAGGLHAGGFSLVAIESSTIAGNLASTGGGSGGGGGVVLAGANVEATFTSSVVAGNTDSTASGGESHDILLTVTGGPPIVHSGGFNLLGSNEGAAADFPASPTPGQPNINGDFVGTNAAPIDPLLGALADHGGLTRTREPLPGSPLLDQGQCPGATRDQRGYSRLETGLRIVDQSDIDDFGDGCDIGALEHGATSVQGLLHADDFESGTVDAWSAVAP